MTEFAKGPGVTQAADGPQVGPAERIAGQAVEWLRETYDDYAFYVQRDVAWTLQNRLSELVGQAAVDLCVFNDYLVLDARPRPCHADLVLVGSAGTIEVALEISYEPSHRRRDIPASRLPMVFWGQGVVQDVQRAQQYVKHGAVVAGWSLFIDEGGHFRERTAPPGSEWHDWRHGKWALISRFARS